MYKRGLSLITYILTAALLCSCTPVDTNINPVTSDTQKIESEETENIQPSVTIPPDVTSGEIIEADIPEIEYKSYSKMVEAESGITDKGLFLSQKRDGYSGVGYISGFDKQDDDNLEISILIPSTQHYNITIVLASDIKMNNIVTVNGEEVGEIITSGSGNFEPITLHNVFVRQGLKSIGIKQVTGGIDVDYIYIQSSTDIENLNITPDTELINKNADDKTKNTMKFLCDNFGKNIISGQYATPGTQNEPDLIYSITGHYPALRLGDLAGYTSSSGYGINEIERAIEWSKRGGLISYVWHWEAPLGEPSYYADETDFDISKAVTDIDISQMSIEEITELEQEGKISNECLAVVKDIDTISAQLLRLQDNGVTVLWRPLNEASGGWFWWGAKGYEPYQWLWDLLYQRQTEYHKLNNLIWVWNAQDTGWYVGDDKCDIISADVYDVSGFQISQVNTYIQFSKISSNKLIALSECARVPNVNDMLRDKAMWSWFGVWYGEYIMDTAGALSETYSTKDMIINTYSHENIITLENLPDLRINQDN